MRCPSSASEPKPRRIRPCRLRHVDFSYEVSRSIAACQGALLLVDCTKGVQAQTVANFWLAFEQDLAILPVVNKVDLGHADVQGALEQMATAFDTEADDALCISAKTGLGSASMSKWPTCWRHDTLSGFSGRAPQTPCRATHSLSGRTTGPDSAAATHADAHADAQAPLRCYRACSVTCRRLPRRPRRRCACCSSTHGTTTSEACCTEGDNLQVK